MKIEHVAKKRVVLKPLQLEALLAAVMEAHGGSLGGQVELQQTYTPSGGTHTYIEIRGVEYHLTANGKLVKLGIIER